MQRFRSVVIPAEIEARELDAKLLLACMAAKRGWTAYVGSRFAINLVAERLPPSVRLEKGITARSERMFRLTSRLGHVLMAWDEEGLVRHEPELYYARRMSPDTVALASTLLAWGEDDAEVWRKWPHYASTPIVITGNPRVDLLRPELRGYWSDAARQLRDRFGELVLINSNFGTVNFFYPRLSRFSTERESSADSGPGTLIAHRRGLFRHFLEMVPALARAFPQQRFVLRPHPAENAEIWRRACEGHENVSVVLEGSVLPWLLAARMIVHNGCTTGIEAALLDRPVVAYCPITSERWDIALPNAVSHRAFDLRELVSAIERVTRGLPLAESDPTRRDRILDAHIAARTGPFASERIMDAVEALAASPPRHAHPALTRLVAMASLGRRRRKKRRKLRREGSTNSREFRDHSFPPVPVDEIRRRVSRMRAACAIVPEVSVDELAPNVFRIERADLPTRHGRWRWTWTRWLP